MRTLCRQSLNLLYQRKCFIDKKIREKFYPTAVTLAADYEIEYGKKVDPRTIAADIAELREKYQAPISYDSHRKGYCYSNESFQLNILDIEQTPIPLETLAPELYPKSAFLPPWQQELLLLFTRQVLPKMGEKNTSSNPGGNISVIPPRVDMEDSNEYEKILLEALHSEGVVTVTAEYAGQKTEVFYFQPLHLICEGKERFFFGRKFTQTFDFSFIILNAASIIQAEINPSAKETAAKSPSENLLNPFMYIQTTGSNDLEVVISDKKTDTVLIFSCEKSRSQALLIQYELLAKLELLR